MSYNPYQVNQSVSGTVDIGTQSGSVVAFQGAGWSGSVAAVITNTVTGVSPAGSITSITMPAGSITAVSGTVSASLVGVGMSNQGDGGSALMQFATTGFSRVFNGSNWDRWRGDSSIGGLVSTGASSVITTQGTSPWIVAPNNSSLYSLQLAGSIMAISGSLTPAANQSVSGAVTAQAGSIMAISGTVTNLAGSVAAVSATQGTTPWIIGSVYGNISGSVAATVTNTVTTIGVAASITGVRTDNASVITLSQSSSILSVPVGSTIAVIQGSSLFSAQQGTWRVSVAGGYATGATSIVSGLGIMTLGVRNDGMNSVFGIDGTYHPEAIGPTGEQIVANSPITKWVRGFTTLTTAAGGSVLVIAAGGAGVFTYITGIQYGGFGPQSVLLTIASGLGSVLGRFPVPGGTSQQFGVIPNALKTGANAVVTASIGGAAATTSSVFVGIQGFSSNT